MNKLLVFIRTTNLTKRKFNPVKAYKYCKALLLGLCSFLFFNNAHAQNPGDVTPVYWLKADAGVTHSSNAVTNWADQSASGFDAADPGAAANRPTFLTNQVNGNPAISFDGGDFLNSGDVLSFTPSTDSWSFYTVLNVGTGNTGTIISRANGGASGRQWQYYIAGNEFRQRIGGTNNNPSGTQTFTGNWAIGSSIHATSSFNTFFNGATYDPGTEGSATQTTNVILGARNNGSNQLLTGQVAEVIMFNSNLSSADQRDVETYLAIKYGLTLDITSSGYTIGGTDVFTGSATYDNDIIAIGQDDSQGLDQTSSSSVNTTGVITLSAATSQDDGDFLIVANNAGTAGTLGSSFNGGTTNGSNRIWFVEEENEIGTVTITVDKSDLPSNVEALYVKNNDATLGTGGTLYSLVDGGSTWSVTVNFSNNDYFSFVSVPEMQVTGNSVEIVDGDATPSSSDDTDNGDVDIAAGSNTITYTINNTGNGILTLGSNAVSISGTHSADYSVAAQPATTVAASGNTTFQITFNPSATGTRSASISIANDDANENPYNFDVEGNGVILPPEMQVTGNGTEIVDGDATPSASDDTDYGSENITSGSNTITYTINNTGTGTLTLGSNAVSISGSHSADYSVAAQPATTVAASGNTTFQITFNPSATGVRSAAISIANDDSDENPYNFSIQGTGTASPEMDVSGNSVSITDGDATPSTADHTDFGNTTSSVSRVFTITNSGDATLNLSGSPRVSLSGSSDFTVTAQPSSTVASGGGTTTFTVQFSPSSSGTLSASVSITNDDGDENPYNFSISGSNIPAPGDQTSDLVFWLKADAGVTDTGNEVDQWTDQSTSGFNATGTTTTRPTIQTNRVNGNPALDFDGNDYMDAGNNLNFDPGVDTWSYFSVFNVSNGNTGTLLSRASSGTTGNRQWQYLVTGNEFGQVIGGTFDNPAGTQTITGNWAIGSSIHAASTYATYVDGSSYDTGTPGSAANESTNIIVGARSSGSGFILTGEIAELIMFNSNLSAANQRDVETYLAIKYGLTLDITSRGYTLGGSDIFTGSATYDNDIIALGQDDSQGLDQTSSTSVNSSGIITLSAATSQEDGDFLIVANNGGTASTLGSSYNGGSSNGSNRIWFVEEENEIGTVTITVTKANLPSNVESLYVKNNDAALGTGGTLYSLADGGATWSVSLDLENNDYFSFVSVPEMQVTGNSVEIADGDATPSTGDHTDYGSVDINGGSNTITYTINNTGNGTLNLGSNAVSISGSHAADFSVAAQPSTTVAAGGNTTFQITFDPSATGVRSAAISITNDDANENPYNYSIQGTGIETFPEIQVTGNSVEIVDGDLTPASGDNTDYGNVDVSSGSNTITYTINNTDVGTLTLGSNAVSISGTHAADYSVAAQPATTVAGSGNTTFQITFDPSAAGLRTAAISIANDDADENPYNFNIQGTGVISPEIIVSGNSISISDGDTSPTTSDHTDFGNTSSNVSRTFTITNTGAGTLNLSGSPIVSISGSSDFTVTSQPSSTVASGGGTTTFVVQFTPSGFGSQTASISITNDDSDENPFNFDISGTNLVGPGDVTSNVSLWLKANEGVTASSNAVSTWSDQSGNSNNATQATSIERPTYVSSGFNGNPYITFDGSDDDLAGTAGFDTRDYFIVLDPDEIITNDNVSESPLGYSAGSANNALTLGAASGSITNEIITHEINSTYYVSGLTSTSQSIINPSIINFKNNSGATQQELYLDGAAQTESTSGTFNNLTNVAYVLGDNTQGSSTFGGRIAELISFSSRLSDTERRNVATYLAIKYGITLDISSQNYLVNGSAIYDNSSYTNDIAGIGHDESQGLDQTSSKSINPGSLICISNPASLGDGDYLLWGNDGGNLTTTTSNVPGGTTERLNRIWRVDVTNTVGTVDIVFDVTSLGIDASSSTFNLIVAGSGSSMPSGLSSATVSSAGTVATNNGTTTVTFSSVLINDDEFFTLAGTFTEVAPGDLTSNISLWLSADHGITESSGSVSKWIDRSGNELSALQENTSDQPSYTTDQVNGNPKLSFDGNDFLNLGDVLNFSPSTDAFSVFTVFNSSATGTLIGKAENASSAGRQYQIYAGTNYYNVIGGTVTLGSASVTDGTWQVGSNIISTTNVNSYIQGASDVSSGGIGSTTEAGANVMIGAIGNGLYNIYTGDIAEILMFDTNLSNTNRRNVETYLALKYGLTLDISSQDYTVGGSSIYTHNSYSSDIAGIGVDTSQGLNVTTSESSNSGSMVSMQNASAITDGEFLVWGNNNGGTAITTSNVPGGTTERLTQIWRVDETGTVGTVDVVFDITSLTVNTVSSTFNLIISPTAASMPTGLSSASVSSAGTVSTVGGSVVVTFSSVDFTDGDFFTLAGTFTDEAPGDISSNLTLWLKADNGPVLNGSTITDWIDRSGNSNSATQATTANQPTLMTDAINGNTVVQFDGSNDYFTGSAGMNTTDYFIVVKNDDIIYNDESTGGTPIGYNDGVSTLSGIHFGAITGSFTDEVISYLVSGAYGVALSSTSTNYSNPLVINAKNNSGGTAQNLYVNGVTVNNTSAGTYANYSGNYNLGSDATEANFYTGGIAEVISYSSRLSDANRRDVATYLAIKYGISLNIASQNYTVGGSSIFSHSSYANDIAGIGQNDSQGLSQTSSTSVSGNTVTVSNSSGLADGEYLIWGHDGTAISVTTSNVPGGTTNRLARIWRAAETGDVGTVDIEFNLNSLGLTTDGTYNLIVAGTGATMPTGLSSATVSSTGTVTTTNGVSKVKFTGITINTGEYFTLAGSFSKPSPGAVSSGLSLWLKADYGVVNSSNIISEWIDASGLGNNAIQGESARQPSYLENDINFNPVIKFNDDYIGGPAGLYTREFFIVIDPDYISSNSEDTGDILGYEKSSWGGLELGPSIGVTNNELISHSQQGNGRYDAYFLDASGTIILNNPLILNDRWDAGNDGQQIILDGETLTMGETAAGNWQDYQNQPYRLGHDFVFVDDYDGGIAEVISYSSKLSDSDRRDVATYLAIKYGITLDISGANPFDAYTVGGAEIYNDTSYPNDIAGIGKNVSTQGLNQIKSKSINDASIVEMSNASDLDEAEYLVWGNDDGGTTLTTSNVPSGITERLTQIWKVDETGDVGTVTVAFDITTLGVDSANTTLNMIISPSGSTMPTALSTGTLVTSGTFSTVNGREIITFTTVDFADGDYFTLGGDVQTTAPGGVSSGLTVWMKANKSVNATSNAVSSWGNIVGGGGDASQGNSADQPTLVSDAINFNEALSFDGTDFLDGSSGFNTTEYFVVVHPTSTVNSSNDQGFVLGYESGNSSGLLIGPGASGVTNEVVTHTVEASNTYRSAVTGASSYEGPIVINSRNNLGGSAQDLVLNGEDFTESTSGTYGNLTSQFFRIGIDFSATSAYNGQIAEIISYSSRLSDANRRNVSSYLAVKYGITLDISGSSPFNAYTVSGSAIYDNTSYATNIAGIGVNFDHGLNQTTSQSVNSDAIIRMQDGSDLGTGEYVVWGKDSGDATSLQSSELASGYDRRLAAEWSVDVTGSPGTVTVRLYAGNISGFSDLSNNASFYTLLVDDDNDFSADLVSAVQASSLSNDTLVFTGVTFADNYYFTLALPTPPSPGDVSTNLSLWLKADAEVTQSSNIVSDWTDQSGNDHDASQGTSASRPTFTLSALNGNPVIDFDGSDDELGGISGSGFYSQEYFVVFSPDNTASSGSGAEAVLGYSSGSDNGLYLGSSFGSLTNEIITHYVTNGGTYGRAETHASNTRSGYNLLSSRNNSGATAQELYLNGNQIDNSGTGSLLNVSDVDYVLGDRFSGGLSFNGKIAEVISYSSRITTASNRRDIETYLAVKYGLTIDISGADPYDAYTVEGTEIYKQPSYANDIAAIASNGSQGLNQSSSKSINTGAIVTISTPSSLSDGDYLVWGHDNGVTSTTTSGLPSGSDDRMTRKWAVNETGDVGTVSLVMDLSGLGYSAKTAGNFRLILDSDADFTNGVSNLVSADSYSSDILTFTSVEMSSISYFGLVTTVNNSLDTDTDGIPDYFETAYGTNPASGDDPVSGGSGGTDSNSSTGINSDGISDALEKILDDNGATGPITRLTDTDGDGISDYLEVADGTDPFSANSPTASGSDDSDKDGLPDALEVYIAGKGGAANPAINTDTDGDGIPDYYEVLNNEDPNDSNDPVSGGGSANDSNNTTGSGSDNISDALEAVLISGGASSPVETTTDTDSDGIPDYIEAQTMTDPFNSGSPFASGTPTVRSLQADYEVKTGSGNCLDISGYQWIDVTDNLGNLVFSINPVGNNLGSTCWAVRILNSNDDLTRNDGTDYILDRNWFIDPTTQPSSVVYIRFYTLNDEHTDLGDQLLSSESFAFSDSDLRITKIAGVLDLDPFVSGGTRTIFTPNIASYTSSSKSLTIGITTFSTFDPHVNPGAPNNPLPVELIEFNAELEEEKVIVSWATAAEIDNDYFTIERSADGTNFNPIAQIDGAGNSDERIDYNIIDRTPIAGTGYYRIKQTDFDGSYTYSEVKFVDYTPRGLSWKFYPNPTTGKVNILSNDPDLLDNGYELTAFDLVGRKLEVPYTKTNQGVEVDLSNLKTGIYLIEINVNGIRKVSRVIKN